LKAIDTTVAVDYLRGAAVASDLLESLLGSGVPVVASEVVRFELLAGVREHARPALESFCSALSWVAVDEEVSRVGGDLARRYRAAFGGIDDLDYLIAATALVVKADLLTTNVRHFPMFEGLQPAY
jgi:predicted nucleic acid-binding protein